MADFEADGILSIPRHVPVVVPEYAAAIRRRRQLMDLTTALPPHLQSHLMTAYYLGQGTKRQTLKQAIEEGRIDSRDLMDLTQFLATPVDTHPFLISLRTNTNPINDEMVRTFGHVVKYVNVCQLTGAAYQPLLEHMPPQQFFSGLATSLSCPPKLLEKEFLSAYTSTA